MPGLEPATAGPRPRGAPGRTATAAKAGFTLLEVLIAFGILALLLGLLFQAFSGGLRAAGSAERRITAVLLAKSQLARLEAAGDLAPGKRGGELPDGYRWRAEITAYRDGELGDPAHSPLLAHRVELTVSWGNGADLGNIAQDKRTAASVTLTTLALGSQP